MTLPRRTTIYSSRCFEMNYEFGEGPGTLRFPPPPGRRCPSLARAHALRSSRERTPSSSRAASTILAQATPAGRRGGVLPSPAVARETPPQSVPRVNRRREISRTPSRRVPGHGCRGGRSRDGTPLEVRRSRTLTARRGRYTTIAWVPTKPIVRARRALVPTPHAPVQP